MNIRIKKGNPLEQYWSEWNDAGANSYDVLDNSGELIKNFDTYKEAEDYIKKNEPKSILERFGRF